MITITIDGPAGSGKGTTAKLLAEKLGFQYLDSGAMYRAVAVYLAERGVNLESVTEENISGIILDFDGQNHICINGEEYESRIRTAEAGIGSSQISSQPIVRACVISAGQKILERNNYVLEGRDTGTVWAPSADVKIYLVADPTVRAHRRFLDLRHKGDDITEAEVLKQIVARDYRDMSRLDGPLVKPEGAYEIDTTHITIPEQVEQIYEIVTRKSAIYSGENTTV
ncbi:MAG: (d)CMP kinase [Candidatus Gracilibacteria bacterium]